MVLLKICSYGIGPALVAVLTCKTGLQESQVSKTNRKPQKKEDLPLVEDDQAYFSNSCNKDCGYYNPMTSVVPTPILCSYSNSHDGCYGYSSPRDECCRASSLDLEDKIAKQVGCLSRGRGIDKVVGKRTQTLNLWRRLLLAVKAKYPLMEDTICHSGKWAIMDRNIQYLRELALQELIYHDLGDPQPTTDLDEVQCIPLIQRKFLRQVSTLTPTRWGDKEAPTVDAVASQLQKYEENLSTFL
ncbi:ubiquitin carboxyl-terminal hydrolase 4 [Limosa lapponica baueri]|uniref:Ubiquitin carboxyl-terminal hydrolase 4 n=1 Tax=Limosa lapponica baueri TaxID=1758121 RepID=A0A2I0UDW1_LIMLA|nr:ubiquitin carboxyl-terminal hydrolase 4 [Limosa lapponica baueri]